MNKLFTILLSISLLISSTLASIQSADTVFSNVNVLDVGDDAVRLYTMTTGADGYFQLVGASVHGSIANGAASGSLDSCIFHFDGGVASPVAQYVMAYMSVAGQVSQSTAASASGDFAGAYYGLYAILEFEETNGVAGYQAGDTVLGWTKIGPLTFATTYATQNFNTNAGGSDFQFPVYVVTSTTTNNLVTLRFVVSGAPVHINGTTLNSETTKIDLEINGYYSSNNQASLLCDATKSVLSCDATGPSTNPNSRLALISYFASATASVDGSAQTLSSDAGAVSTQFSWVSEVEVNGTSTAKIHTSATAFGTDNRPAIVASLNIDVSYSGQLLIHSFDTVTPDNIVWDPTIGAERNSASVLLPSITLLLVLLACLF